MDKQQTTEVIFAGALTYTFWDDGIGCAVGLPSSKMLYDLFISDHFPYAVWSLPVRSSITTLLFITFAATLAVYAPAKGIRNTSATEAISKL